MMYEKPYDHSENDYVLFNFERKSLTHSISKCNNDQKNAADAIFDAGTVTNWYSIKLNSRTYLASVSLNIE